MVDADLPALQKLVRAEQERIRSVTFDSDLANGAPPDTYQDAAILIMRYANTCSFTGMRGLLTESMLEKANAAQNPLDGSRILAFSTLTAAQRTAVLQILQGQDAFQDAAEVQAQAEALAEDDPSPPEPDTTSSEPEEAPNTDSAAEVD